MLPPLTPPERCASLADTEGLSGDATAAPGRIDEEILQLGTVVLARGDGSEPDDPVVARWAGDRDQGAAGGDAVAGEDQELGPSQQHRSRSSTKCSLSPAIRFCRESRRHAVG